MSKSKHDYTCTLTSPPPDAACSNDAYGGGEIAYYWGLLGKGKYSCIRVKCGEGEVVDIGQRRSLVDELFDTLIQEEMYNDYP